MAKKKSHDVTNEELMRGAQPTDALKLTDEDRKALEEHGLQSDLRRSQDWSILANQVVGGEI